MDRTDELFGILRLHNVDPTQSSSSSSSSSATLQSGALRIAVKVAGILAENDTLVERMIKLTSRKEFSNDPTAAMANLSESFEMRISATQIDLHALKKAIDDNRQWVGHQQAHYKLVYESLQRRSSGHLQSFQSSIKTHMSHVNQRQARVMKYGQAQTININGPIQMSDRGGSKNGTSSTAAYDVGGGKQGGGGGSGGYAMFGMPRPSSSSSGHGATSAVESSQDDMMGLNNSTSQLRRRKEHVSSSSSAASTSFGGAATQVQTQIGNRNDAMYRQSQKVEKSIAQMGELFSQMANLVMAQGETVTRIEDDVESGLMETKEAHKSMESFYEITKGNRSMILKIFAIMIFFTFVYVYF